MRENVQCGVRKTLNKRIKDLIFPLVRFKQTIMFTKMF